MVVTTAAERQAAHEAARAKHPLRNHPRFRLATPERRTTSQVTVTGSPRWVPGGHAGDALACAGLRQRDDDDHSGLPSQSARSRIKAGRSRHSGRSLSPKSRRPGWRLRQPRRAPRRNKRRLPLSRTSGSLGEARRRARDNCFQPNSATRSDQSGSPITVRSDASLAAWPCRNQRCLGICDALPTGVRRSKRPSRMSGGGSSTETIVNDPGECSAAPIRGVPRSGDRVGG